MCETIGHALAEIAGPVCDEARGVHQAASDVLGSVGNSDPKPSTWTLASSVGRSYMQERRTSSRMS